MTPVREVQYGVSAREDMVLQYNYRPVLRVAAINYRFQVDTAAPLLTHLS